ncbi:MAG: hypothetical protein WD554_06175 [Flavobacteriaceae bacterium]
MKTFVLGIAFLGISCFLNAQNDIAYVDVNKTSFKSAKTTPVINASYLQAIEVNLVPERVKAFQTVVANYDIKQAAIYSAVNETTYDVVFTEGKNSIKAVYDHNGNIIQCDEKFEEVRVPYFLSTKITTMYPGWSYEKVLCTISYNKDEEPQINYKVVLKKNSKKKTISIDATDFI